MASRPARNISLGKMTGITPGTKRRNSPISVSRDSLSFFLKSDSQAFSNSEKLTEP